MPRPRWIDLHALHVVETLAREGGFQAAADALGISQPTVSYRVKRLEEDLGFEIFRRSSRGPEPTERGAVLIAEARELLDHHDRLQRRLAPAEPGALVIGLPEMLAGPLARSLREALGGHDELMFEVASSGTLRECLRSGSVDVAITLGGDEDGASRSRVGSIDVGWYAARGAGADDYVRQGVLQLSVFGAACPFRRSSERALREAGIPYRHANEVDGLSGLLGLLATGDSVSALPRLTADAERPLHALAGLPQPRPVALSVDVGPRAGGSVAYRVADLVLDRLHADAA